MNFTVSFGFIYSSLGKCQTTKPALKEWGALLLSVFHLRTKKESWSRRKIGGRIPWLILIMNDRKVGREKWASVQSMIACRTLTARNVVVPVPSANQRFSFAIRFAYSVCTQFVRGDVKPCRMFAVILSGYRTVHHVRTVQSTVKLHLTVQYWTHTLYVIYCMYIP